MSKRKPLKKALTAFAPLFGGQISRAWTRVPGAASSLRQIREKRARTPEDKYLEEFYSDKNMPQDPPTELPLSGAYADGYDVVRNMGLPASLEGQLAEEVNRMVNASRTEVGVRKAVAGWRLDHPNIDRSLLAELGLRALALYRSKREQQGDFVVKSNMNPHAPISELLNKAFGANQSNRGKMARPVKPGQIPGKQAPPQERASPGRPSPDAGGDHGQKPYTPEDDDNRPGRMAHDGGGAGDDDDTGGDKYAAPATSLDTGDLDDVPQDEDQIRSKLKAVHAELLQLSQQHAETDAEKHMHNHIIETMRDVNAQPTPEGLRDVLHLVHHFSEMAQGAGEAPPPEVPEDPNAPPVPGSTQQNGAPPKEFGKSLVLDLSLTNLVAPRAPRRHARRAPSLTRASLEPD